LAFSFRYAIPLREKSRRGISDPLLAHHQKVGRIARRTLNDCALAGLSPDLLRQATKQALARGLVTKAELADVEKTLNPFGGIRG
jgi:hypothetical protein